MPRELSAKDKAFEKEKLKLRKQIADAEHKAKYWRLECEKEIAMREYYEKLCDTLEAQLDIPRAELLAHIKRTKAFDETIKPLMDFSKQYLY